jgi:DNA-binding NarL/FixJ family response regulator
MGQRFIAARQVPEKACLPVSPQRARAMSSDKTTVLIVEDEPEFRLRFKQIVESEPTLELVGVAASKREAQELIDQTRFDVMLIDLGLPDGNGTDLIRQVSTKRPDVDIMVVTVFGDEQHVVSAIEAGATGYILKDSTAADVVSCIRLLRAGGSPVSPVVARSVLRAIRNRMGERDRRDSRHLAAHRHRAYQEDLPQAGGALARRSRV